jgi:predicted transcriptional regulator
VTDRDIVCGQLAQAADLYCLTVGNVMTRDPLTVPAHAGLTDALGAMSQRAVRRAPVVDDAGSLVGIITLDDVLPEIARELNELARIVDSQAHLLAHLTPEQRVAN